MAEVETECPHCGHGAVWQEEPGGLGLVECPACGEDYGPDVPWPDAPSDDEAAYAASFADVEGPGMLPPRGDDG